MYLRSKQTDTPVIADAPITVSDVKTHLRLFDDDSVTDAYLTELILSAVDMCSAELGESITKVRFNAYYTNFSDLVLPHSNIDSVNLVQYYNTSNTLTTVSNAVYYLDDTLDLPAIKLQDGQNWPNDLHSSRAGKVSIIYDNQYGNEGLSLIHQAILIVVSDLYSNQSSITDMKVSSVPTAAKTLLNKYRRYLK